MLVFSFVVGSTTCLSYLLERLQVQWKECVVNTHPFRLKVWEGVLRFENAVIGEQASETQAAILRYLLYIYIFTDDLYIIGSSKPV